VYFSTTADDGHTVTGYFVPDSFSGKSVIRVVPGSGEPFLFAANWTIPSLVEVGRHETGLCGFRIDASVLPNLADILDFEIREPETGLRIYRRRPTGAAVAAKIFRLETQLEPLTQLDASVEPRFQFHYGSIERLGHETAAQIFQLIGADSSYASGRLLIKPYEFFLDNCGFRTVCMLRDPFDELAERLIVLQRASQGDSSTLDARDLTLFEPAIAFAASLDLADDRQLARAFRGISRGDALNFADPLVRSLTARAPDEFARDASIASAIQTLSGFAVVGLRACPEPFIEALAALLDIDRTEIPAIAESPAVTELGHKLRSFSSVKSLLEFDLEVYAQVESALAKLL
jgi:hypothetical protein